MQATGTRAVIYLARTVAEVASVRPAASSAWTAT
jgi:hypothetical protein